MASVSSFLERKLCLRVNWEKSAVAPVWERKFLRHWLLPGGRLGLGPESLKRVKARIRRITRRNRGVSLEGMVHELNSFLTGWVTYFRYAECRTYLGRVDSAEIALRAAEAAETVQSHCGLSAGYWRGLVKADGVWLAALRWLKP